VLTPNLNHKEWGGEREKRRKKKKKKMGLKNFTAIFQNQMTRFLSKGSQKVPIHNTPISELLLYQNKTKKIRSSFSSHLLAITGNQKKKKQYSLSHQRCLFSPPSRFITGSRILKKRKNLV
jgi:hypothetical protein